MGKMEKMVMSPKRWGIWANLQKMGNLGQFGQIDRGGPLPPFWRAGRSIGKICKNVKRGKLLALPHVPIFHFPLDNILNFCQM
jgi:hypothetical protein